MADRTSDETETLSRQESPGPAEPEAARRAARKPVTSPQDLGLTERQKAIGRVLDLAEPTVRNHVTAVLKALNVTNRTEAVIAVVELGWDLRPTPS